MARLGDICKLNMGQSPDSASYNESGDGLPFFQGNADFGIMHPNVRVWCNAPTKIAHTNDILISVRAPIGALNIADRDCCIGRGLAALTVDSSICEQKYLWYAISSKVDDLNSKGTGSTFKAISKSVLADTDIPLPPLKTQRHIAAVLDKVGDLIALRKRQLSALDELIKARFVEMFGDPLIGTAQWPIHTVGDVAESIDPQPSHRTPPIDENGIPYVSMKDCNYQTGEIDFSNARKVGHSVLEEHRRRYTLHDGDFIIGKIGTIGNPIFVPARDDYTLSANIVLIQPDKSKVSPLFLKYSFMTDFMERQFDEAKNSTSQAAFGIQKVRSIKVMNPPIQVQMDFDSFVIQVEENKSAIRKSLIETQTLFGSLMQQYFG